MSRSDHGQDRPAAGTPDARPTTTPEPPHPRTRRTGRRGEDRGRSRPATGPSGGGRRRSSGPPGRNRYRRALRREAPTIVGVLLDPADFTAMTRYRSFPFPDHRTYLRHLDGMLRGLDRTGIPVALTPFDPHAYDEYCRGTRQPPDTPATRARYVAQAAGTGALLPYSRRPIAALRADLAREAERHATWQRATDLLVTAGTCAECGQDLAHCAFDRATDTLLRLVEALHTAGEGPHHLVCSVPAGPDRTEPPLTASVHLACGPDHEPELADSDTLVLCTLLAVCAVHGSRGGLVARTFHAGSRTPTATVRGWELRAGEPVPLTEAEVFDAYCTDPRTGEPVPPEPDVRYAPGLPLPPPPDDRGDPA